MLPITEIPFPSTIGSSSLENSGNGPSSFGSNSSQSLDEHAFASLMGESATDPTAATATATASASARPVDTSPSLMEHMAISHNSELRDLLEAGRHLSSSASTMSMAEVSGLGADFGLRMQVMTSQFQIATHVGKSAGKGFETLMRNQ
jgi:hypothetical protein